MTTGRSNADIVLITVDHSAYKHDRSKSHIVKCKDYYWAVVAPLVVNTTMGGSEAYHETDSVARLTTSHSGEQHELPSIQADCPSGRVTLSISPRSYPAEDSLLVFAPLLPSVLTRCLYYQTCFICFDLCEKLCSFIILVAF